MKEKERARKERKLEELIVSPKMMSQHISSMLEHLRMGPLKKAKVPIENDDTNTTQAPSAPSHQSTTTSVAGATATTTTMMTTTTTERASDNAAMLARGNGAVQSNYDETDNSRISVVINETRKKSLRDIPNGMVNLMECEKKFDPRKRYSIGNGDLRVNGKSRELSPTPTRIIQQRKLSADMRLRGSNNQLSEDYVLRRPVRLRSLTTNFEVYDSLHTKALDVSTTQFFYFTYKFNHIRTVS